MASGCGETPAASECRASAPPARLSGAWQVVASGESVPVSGEWPQVASGAWRVGVVSHGTVTVATDVREWRVERRP